MSDELTDLRRFLDGSAPLDGVWYGENHPDKRGMYWWRKRLPAIDRAAADLAQLRAQVAALTAERDRYREALEGVERFFIRPGENANEKFERIGEDFYRETHMLRPGKSASMDCPHTYEERNAAFDAWCAAKAAKAN